VLIFKRGSSCRRSQIRSALAGVSRDLFICGNGSQREASDRICPKLWQMLQIWMMSDRLRKGSCQCQ
jgi:hypothetical protein